MFEKMTGWYGETLTAVELLWVNLFGRKGKILRNIYVPKGNGETSEIDVVYITKKGIFVFESKNYSGWIFGDERQTYWTATLPNREKNRFYNPVKQNQTHIKWLGEYLSDPGIPLFSVIVFSERCELKKVTVTSVKVVKRDRLYAAVREIWDNADDVLNESNTEAVYEKLKPLTKVTRQEKKEHIERIQEKLAPKDSEKLCPKCGAQLVLRTAKKGPNAGNQFWGCPSFPKCRYTESVDGGE